jgi:hypothetical protein
MRVCVPLVIILSICLRDILSCSPDSPESLLDKRKRVSQGLGEVTPSIIIYRIMYPEDLRLGGLFKLATLVASYIHG